MMEHLCQIYITNLRCKTRRTHGKVQLNLVLSKEYLKGILELLLNHFAKPFQARGLPNHQEVVDMDGCLQPPLPVHVNSLVSLALFKTVPWHEMTQELLPLKWRVPGPIHGLS